MPSHLLLSSATRNFCPSISLPNPTYFQSSYRYYRLLMYYYACSLRRASFLMVNSSWTKNHIDAILRHSDPLLDFMHLSPSLFTTIVLNSNKYKPSKSPEIVYPPCHTREMVKFSLERREPIILSVAQFRYVTWSVLIKYWCIHILLGRPEKDHAAKLYALHELLTRYPEHRSSKNRVKLLLVGGVRNEDDAARVQELRLLAEQLDVQVSLSLHKSHSPCCRLTFLQIWIHRRRWSLL